MFEHISRWYFLEYVETKDQNLVTVICRGSKVGWLVSWLIVLFSSVLTLLKSFKIELSHFDKSLKQLSLV